MRMSLSKGFRSKAGKSSPTLKSSLKTSFALSTTTLVNEEKGISALMKSKSGDTLSTQSTKGAEKKVAKSGFTERFLSFCIPKSEQPGNTLLKSSSLSSFNARPVHLFDENAHRVSLPVSEKKRPESSASSDDGKTLYESSNVSEDSLDRHITKNPLKEIFDDPPAAPRPTWLGDAWNIKGSPSSPPLGYRRTNICFRYSTTDPNRGSFVEEFSPVLGKKQHSFGPFPANRYSHILVKDEPLSKQEERFDPSLVERINNLAIVMRPDDDGIIEIRRPFKRVN